MAKERYPRIQAAELIRRGNDVVFIQINNKRGFLFGRKEMLRGLPKIFPLTLVEKQKVSMNKQIMDLHMGRKPQQYKEESRTYYATMLEMPKAGVYTAWEII